MAQNWPSAELVPTASMAVRAGERQSWNVAARGAPNRLQWLFAIATFPLNEVVKNETALALLINTVFFSRSPFPNTSKAICVTGFTASSDAELSLFLDLSLG